MQTAEHSSLISALAVRPRELVSFVGGGGKSTALVMLAREGAAGGAAVEGEVAAGAWGAADRTGAGTPHRILATTTTHMFLHQLEAAGPVLLRPSAIGLLGALQATRVPGGIVAAARGAAADGKVDGLPVEWVDELWAAGVADRFLVEADGSKGLSLKALGPHEPQVPAATTLIVQVAGLDVLGAALDAAHVHRAEVLVAALSSPSGLLPGVKLGEPVTPTIVVAALRVQLRLLRRRFPAARIVTLLNKVGDDERRAAALEIAEVLLAGPPEEPRPEAVIAGSFVQGAFLRCVPGGPLVSAVVLAAGRSSRMGVQKLLLPVAGRPMIEGVVAAAARSRVVETVAVVGSEAGPVRAAIDRLPVRIVDNPDYELGMSTSLRAGLSSVRPDCAAVLFVLGDQPFVTSAMIDRLIGRFAETGFGMVRPFVGGRPAHPVLIGADFFPEVMALEGDMGARDILARHATDVDLVETADPRSVLDVDTSDDYETARHD